MNDLIKLYDEIQAVTLTIMARVLLLMVRVAQFLLISGHYVQFINARLNF